MMTAAMSSLTAEVVIVGGARPACASAGVETALVANAPAAADHRTSALLQGSVKARLRKLSSG